MMWLPDGEKSLRIGLLVLTEYTNVTDIASRGNKNVRGSTTVTEKADPHLFATNKQSHKHTN